MESCSTVEDFLAGAANLQLLVNNAGFGTMGRFYEASIESQDAMHRVHVLATMRLTHAALRNLTAHNRGAIINVASVAAFVPRPGSISYYATKAWITCFTEGLHLELKSAGSRVRMQALCPGFTYTEFHDVLGIDRNFISKAWWMPAEEVVEASLQGLEQGKLFVVPGWRYKLLVSLIRMMPRAVVHYALTQGPASLRRERKAFGDRPLMGRSRSGRIISQRDGAAQADVHLRVRRQNHIASVAGEEKDCGRADRRNLGHAGGGSVGGG